MLIVNGKFYRRRATVRGVNTGTAARPQPLTPNAGPHWRHAARRQRHPGAIVNAFTTVNPETEATVRAVDYQVVSGAEQFRVYSDEPADVARWRGVQRR